MPNPDGNHWSGQFGVGTASVLLLLGLMVWTGVDKMLETWALTWLPDWAIML
ncbi:hypothetical protein [Marinimicrobium alkaliphilum]|uniref:hypothetical protein n=1 Tax=Marinimicrobium alkaliphilum TaxID=2202654 RepID=UPI001300472E|nr:hypothetical protein [Marinimicrobium alkaliphilum]